MSFDVSIFDMFVCWSNAGTLCILNQNEAINPVAYINRENIDLWFSTPTAVRLLRKLGGSKQTTFPKLRFSFFVGEALTTDIAKFWNKVAPNSSIVNAYGPTEATVLVSLFDCIPELKFIGSSDPNSIMPLGTFLMVWDET